MKHQDFLRALRRTCAGCIAALTLATTPGWADSNAAAPIAVQMSLATPSTITQGEPIVLHYQIANTSPSQKVGILLGIYGTDWYALNLTDKSGEAARRIPDQRERNPKGYSNAPEYLVSPKDSVQGNIIVTQFVAVAHPGSYLMKVHVRIPYGVMAQDEESPRPAIERASKSGSAPLTQDFTFPVVIGEANVSQLQATAKALYDAILAERYGVREPALLDALFAMPEAQASPIWETLALTCPAFMRDQIAAKLANMRSTWAANLLATMLWNPMQQVTPDTQRAIHNHLRDMYARGDGPLRKHIKSLYAAHGVNME